MTYDTAITDLQQRCAESGTDISVQALVWDGSAYLAKPWKGRDDRADERVPWPTEGLYADDGSGT